MPIYDYLCPQCGPFEARRPMSESQAAAACAICAVPAPRVPGASRLNLMPYNNRIAETRNEKSAHEPGVVHRMGGHDAHGHAHGKPSRHAHAHVGGHARQPSPRPWMLGH